jgi:hypothetical protein
VVAYTRGSIAPLPTALEVAHALPSQQRPRRAARFRRLFAFDESWLLEIEAIAAA